MKKNSFDTLRQRSLDLCEAKLWKLKKDLVRFTKELQSGDLTVRQESDLSATVDACVNQIETYQFIKESVILN